MKSQDVGDLVVSSQNGCTEAREALLKQLRQLALHEAGHVCRQPVTESDDAFSVALLALNEAIDTYDPARGARFEGFARLVVRRRVIDHLRAEERVLHLSLDAASVDEELGSSDYLELEEAERRHEMQLRRLQLAEEIAHYEAELARFDLDLDLLVEVTPTHADTRARVYAIAQTLAGEPRLWQEAYTTGRMPLAALHRLTGASRKVLETWRRYILGLALAMSGEYPGMQEHLVQLQGGED